MSELGGTVYMPPFSTRLKKGQQKISTKSAGKAKIKVPKAQQRAATFTSDQSKQARLISHHRIHVGMFYMPRSLSLFPSRFIPLFLNFILYTLLERAISGMKDFAFLTRVIRNSNVDMISMIIFIISNLVNFRSRAYTSVERGASSQRWAQLYSEVAQRQWESDLAKNDAAVDAMVSIHDAGLPDVVVGTSNNVDVVEIAELLEDALGE